VPLGGVVAGLVVPPLVEALGWRMALLVAAAGTIAATLLMTPLRGRIDPAAVASTPAPRMRLVSFRLTDIAVPLRALSSGAGLWRISMVGALLAVAQSCWFTFTVTYLVVGLGLSLTVAGLVFAVMQAASVFGRVLMGWIADRVASSTATLAVAALGSAATTMLLGLSHRGWPVWGLMVVAAVGGLFVSGWNGVMVAEVARRTPPELVGETAAGSVIFVFISNMTAPMVFAAFIAATGRYDAAFMVAGLVSLLGLLLLRGLDRPGRKQSVR